MANIKSFDKFVSEMKHDTLSFRIFGKTYKIAKRIPALLMLEISKYDDGAAIPAKLLFRAAYQIFGEDTIRELGQHPEFTIEVLNELLSWAFAAINGSDDAGMEEVTEDDNGVVRGKN